MDKIKIGLVGTGFIAEFHRNGFVKNTASEVVGMCTNSNIEKLHTMCNEWQIKPYSSFDEMVNDPNVDALVIGSVNTDHYPQIMKAIEMGKHVLAEKPVVTDYSHLDNIINAAKEKGIVVFPGHNFVYRDAILKAKEILESGKLGRICYSSFMSTHIISNTHATGWRSKKELGFGGALMDSGHHVTYMSLFFMGMPQKLHAFKSNLVLNGMECEDIAQVNLVYPDNSIGCIMQSWTSNYGEGVNGIKIFGDKGEIRITDALYFNSEKLSTDVDYANSFVNQAKAFTDCILKGVKPVSTLEDVRNTLKIIYGAYESSENETVVSL